MPKTHQAKKNVTLFNKLDKFLLDNPKELDKLPHHASIIVFSKTDKKLNEMNDKILKSLINEGRKVIKAIQTNNKKNPWQLTTV